ncbi:MAG TPA: phage tail protein [Mycobacteriales bacterium]|nr:phage tail protein [Mycobacteriales bacterium]
MSRAALTELPSRHPLGRMLPAMYAADDFAQRFTTGLDTVLASIFATLDNLAAYFDPRLAPEDFLSWLAGWVAADLDPAWPLPLRRAVVAGAVESYRRQGTAGHLVEWLRLCLGVHAQVHDGGGATWSRSPGTEPTGPPASQIVVRVWPDESAEVRVDSVEQVEALVAAICPAHLTFVVEMLPGPPEQGGG